MLIHLTARALEGRPLADWAVAARLWQSLARVFLGALGAVLMPNHLHLIADVVDAAWARITLAHVLAALLRRPRGRGRERVAPRWQPVPPPLVIPDVAHLRRQLRYVALNPCRAGLVRDPLQWVWSTHRDALGAIASPWVSPSALAAAVRARPTAREPFGAAWHAYVSADPSCAVSGTPPPRPALPSSVATVPLDRIAAAAAAATRTRIDAIQRRAATRRLFVHLAQRQGWGEPATLARACGITVEAVRQLRRRSADALLPAACLCLGDERLAGGQNLNVRPARP